MIWVLAVALVILVIIFLPVALTADYNAQGIQLLLNVGIIRFSLYPKREKPETKNAKNKMTSVIKSKGFEANQKAGGRLSDFLPILHSLFTFLGELRRHIKIKSLDIRITLAGGDPCDLSVNYGRTWAAIGSLQPHLNRIFKIQKQNIDVGCNYVSDETTVICHVESSISLGRLFALIVRYGLRILKQYFTIKKQSKGGTVYEPETSSNA